MTTQTKPPPHPTGVVKPQLRRFTMAEYYALAKAGILTEDDRVELLDGVIYAMSPIGSGHAGCVKKYNRALNVSAGARAVVLVQDPVRLDDGTEPQPDLALLQWRDDYYSTEHPGPADVLLLIEVADTSEDYDRNEKLPLYARAGIPEVWLTIITTEVVEIHTEPRNGEYTVTRRLRAGDVLAPGCFPDIALPVSDILPG